MSHIINTYSKVANTSNYLNMTNTAAIDRNGFWYEYKPVNANNDTLGASVIPYHWGSILTMPSSATEMQIEGTLSLTIEPWDGDNVKYHGGCIVHIGSGVNDITGTQEQDALFFAHLGSLSVPDDAFYWDRMYLPVDSTDWQFYQYHKHLPSFYPTTENNRSALSAIDYIRPADKAYGYMIQLRVRLGATFYQSVLLRVHTPSVGGAHNSHNDITLPQNNSADYQMGGLIKGAGDLFHAFYITSNGTQWDVLSRTYVDASASCTSEISIGTFDLADPTFTVSPGDNYNFPLRASAGDYLNGRIYFPVILNNATSGYDLEIWSFESATTLSTSTLQRTTILTGETVRPDCHICAVGGEMHAVVTMLSANGLGFFSLNPTTNLWEQATGTFITNGTNPIRVHGLRYNPEDISYYTVLSGTVNGGGTYTGPGLYKFDLAGDFPGYTHLDYDYINHAFSVKSPQTAGYLEYSTIDASIKKYNTVEPQGIAAYTQILTRGYAQPSFFNRELNEIPNNYIYQGFRLQDNRKFFAGRVEMDEQSDLFISLVTQDNSESYNFYYGGTANGYQGGTDYITGAIQSTYDPNKVWITGYTKSELVERKDIRVHGYTRTLIDPPNFLCNEDIVIDSAGSVYVLTNDETSFIGYVVKYDNNYNILWQKTFADDLYNITVSKMTIDSNDNIYVIGYNSNNVAIILKFDSDGNELWAYDYTQSSGTDLGKAIAVINTGSTEVIAAAINNSTSSSIVILDTNGNILGQNKIANLTVNVLRKSQSETNRVLFAGYRSGTPNVGKFGMCEIEINIPVVKWVSEFADNIKDIANTNNSSPRGYVIVGASSTNAIIAAFNVTESAGTFTVAKDWSKTLSSSVYNAIAVSPYTETNKYIYVVGNVTNSGLMHLGMEDGIVARYDSTGTLNWQNAFGHDMMEMFKAVTFDMYNRNIIIAGCSTSHSSAKDALFFRCEPNGFSTGVYHIQSSVSMAYHYMAAAQTSSVDSSSITNLTAPASNTSSVIGKNTLTLLYSEGGLTSNIFDGSYGPNGVFMLFFGYAELDKIQSYLNSQEYKERLAAGLSIHPADSFLTLWQVATVGDGTADDGNIFGYDIIESSNNLIYIAGQTSGDVGKTNLGTSGVYDVIGIEYFQVPYGGKQAGEMSFYQDGAALDEEIYACEELSDGRIAFCGRTAGTIGGTNYGGYDILLGLYNPADDTITWYQYGSGLNDRAFNLHDLGNNTLALVYASSGYLGNQVHIGAEDIGVVLFDYNTHTWGNAYQTGTTGSDLLNTQGKPSTLLGDGRIAIAFSTAGNFNSSDPNSSNSGFLDIGLAIFDPSTGTWEKAQIGSQSSEIATSISSDGELLLITGYIEGTFKNETQSLFVECDAGFSFKGITST